MTEGVKPRFLVWCLGSAARTAITTVGEDPVVAVGVNFATAGDQCSAANVIVDVATVEADDATATTVHAVGAVVGDLGIADSNDSGSPVRQDPIAGIA